MMALDPLPTTTKIFFCTLRLKRPKGAPSWSLQLTILKDSLDVEAVGGASLVVGTPLQVVGQLPGSAVVDDARLALTDGVY